MKVKTVLVNTNGIERIYPEMDLKDHDPITKVFKHEGMIGKSVTVEFSDGSKLRYERV